MKGGGDLMNSEEIMIPKTRFDEVNNKYKRAKETIFILEVEMKEKEDELIKTKQYVDEIKSEYAEKKMKLDLREVFIDGGFRKEEYEGIIKRISCPTDEEKLELAKEIVKIKR